MLGTLIKSLGASLREIARTEYTLDTYKIRLQIETLFKVFNSSGFNTEDTHLQKTDKLEKLVMLVINAFVWYYNIGDYINTIKPITIKNPGNRFISFFKLCLNYLSRFLLSKNECTSLNINCFSFCHVLRTLLRKMNIYILFKKP